MPVASRTPRLFVNPGNSQAIKILGLQDIITGDFMNGATLTATLIDASGSNVPGCVGVGMDYVAASNGDYTGVFGDNNFNPPVGTGYTMVVTGNQGAGYIRLEIVAEVKARQE